MARYHLIADQLPEKANDRRLWTNLTGSSPALAISEIAEQHVGLTVVLTQNTSEANQLEDDIRFFLNEDAGVELLHFPDWETLPYDSFSPHQDITSQRVSVLNRLPESKQAILIVSVATLMHRLAPVRYICGHSLLVNVNDQIEIDAFRQKLTKNGYSCVETVYEHGEFAVRGSIVDIFPMGSEVPYRIELFDTEVDTIRTFDPDNQRSIDRVDHIELLPAKEFPLNPDSVNLFKEKFRATFDTNHRQCPIYQDINEGLASAGIEYYLPLFFEQTGDLFDYLPDATLFAVTGQLQQAVEAFLKDAHHRYEDRRHDLLRPILEPNAIFLRQEELFSRLKSFPRVTLQGAQIDDDKPGVRTFNITMAPDLSIDSRSAEPLKKLDAYLSTFLSADTQAGHRVLICAESAGRRETLIELLQRIRRHPKPVSNWQHFNACDDAICIVISPLQQGLELPGSGIIVITEPQLFGQRVSQKRRRKRDGDDNRDNIIKNLTELPIGAPVVHLDHGVGRYLGLQSLSHDGQAQEFLALSYAKGAKLYVPVSSLHLISRYSGVEESLAPLHKLGSE